MLWCAFSILKNKFGKHVSNKSEVVSNIVNLKPFNMPFSFNQEKVRTSDIFDFVLFFIFKVQPNVKNLNENLKKEKSSSKIAKNVGRCNGGALEYEINYEFSKEEVNFFTKIKDFIFKLVLSLIATCYNFSSYGSTS